MRTRATEGETVGAEAEKLATATEGEQFAEAMAAAKACEAGPDHVVHLSSQLPTGRSTGVLRGGGCLGGMGDV
jgi:hypothetical protein